jgi:hypothetical protein
MCATHAVANADDGPGHLGALDIDQMKEVSGVIEPASCDIVSMHLMV